MAEPNSDQERWPRFFESKVSRIGTLLISAGIVAVAVVSSNPPEFNFQWRFKPSKSEPSLVAPTILQVTPISTALSLAEVTASSALPHSRPLVLSGTQPGRNVFEGTAVLGLDADDGQTYAAGALLVNGSRLKEIYSDHVVLERDGQSASLYVGNSPRVQTDIANRLAQVGGDGDGSSAQVNATESLTDYIRPSPLYKDGVFKGIRLIPGQEAAVFEHFGLKSGDVLTAVRSMPIENRTDAIKALREMAQGGMLPVTVERNGIAESLVLDGRIIAGNLSVNSN